MRLYLVNVWDGTVLHGRPVMARTPQAAARKATGLPVTLEEARPTMAGALWVARFSSGSRHGGAVEWPRDEAVRLVRYPHRPRVTPFWTIPGQWLDGERNPIEPVDLAAVPA